jgi:peptidase M28-like protein
MRKVIARHEIPSREEMLAWMRGLGEIGTRLAGSPGGLRAEDRIEGWYREIGLSGVVREEIPLRIWEPAGEAILEVNGGSFPAYPIAQSDFTPPEGIRGPLAYVGQGDPDSMEGRSLEGKIAVAEVPFAPRPYQHLRKTAHAVHDPGETLAREPDTFATWILPTFARAYSWCAARGAIGFVGILKDLRANRHRYHYPYADAREALPLSGAFVGRDDGARLREVLRGGNVEGRLATPGSTYAGASHNILGFLPGASDALVLITSHHDAPFGGLVQDASGMAQVLAMARHFARKAPADRPLSMVFLAATGNLLHNMGARDFLARHAHDLVPRLKLAVAIEHVAWEVEERDGRLAPTGKVEPRGVFVSDRHEILDLTTLAILGNDLRRSFIAPVPEGSETSGEAGPYFGAGIPAITHISGPEYVLTDEDGLELAAIDEMVPVAKTFIEIVEAFMRQAGE